MIKIRCINCGTKVPMNSLSCPVCHMKITAQQEKKLEEIKSKVNTKTIHSKKTPLYVLAFIGIIIFGISFYSFKQVTECTADGCGFKSLFFMGIGIIFIISATITLFIHRNK